MTRRGSSPVVRVFRGAAYFSAIFFVVIIIGTMLSVAGRPGGGTTVAVTLFMVAASVGAYVGVRHLVWTGRAERSAAAEEAARFASDQRLLQRSTSRGLLLDLTPAEFEQASAVILRHAGFRLRRVGKAGDLGADLLGTDAYGRSVVVQCKRYAPGNKVGSPALQSFIGMQVAHHQTALGMFVTTSSFTASARELAAEHGIILFDGERLIDLVHHAQGVGSEGRHAR